MSVVGLESALLSLSNSQNQLDLIAKRVASLPIGVDAPPASDSVDLSAEAVALLQTRNAADASIAVVKTFDEMTQSLLSISG